MGRVAALALVALLVTSVAVFAQATTSTIRGTVEDSSGGVLPGATVTITNVSTKAVATSVTDGRGGYQAVVFPGTYDLKVELEGFKTYEQKAVTISPSDVRGIDVKLEVGAQTETVTVTAQTEVIQTETGAREGVLSAKQIDNLSVLGRSSLELLRILPGVVAPDASAFESVSFGGGANNTQGYTVNGIRSSGNTVQLDGSSLIDIGSNSGVIVTLNNDMVQEVKVQSSNFAAEYGTGGMNVSAITKGGSSKFSGTLLRLQPQLQVRGQRPVQQHHGHARSRRAPSTTRAATSAVRSSSRASSGTATATRRSSSSASKCSARRSTPGRSSARRSPTR